MKPCTEVRRCSIRVYILWNTTTCRLHAPRALSSLFVCLLVRLWTASLRFVQKSNKGKTFTLNPLLLFPCDFRKWSSYDWKYSRSRSHDILCVHRLRVTRHFYPSREGKGCTFLLGKPNSTDLMTSPLWRDLVTKHWPKLFGTLEKSPAWDAHM